LEQRYWSTGHPRSINVQSEQANYGWFGSFPNLAFEHLRFMDTIDTTSYFSLPLSATSGNDILHGTSLYGLGGNDQLYGSLLQSNVLFGNEGQDRLQGGYKDDVLNGGSGDDRLLGNHGQDLLIGGSGNDWLQGGNGDDRLKGGAGRDRLLGGTGNDFLDGGAGMDSLDGGRGQDILLDYGGGDRLTGGGGQDLFGVGGTLAKQASIVTDFKVGTDKIQILRLGATFEALTFESSRNGTIVFDQGQAIAELLGVEASRLKIDSFVFGKAELATTLQSNLDKALSNNPKATGLSAALFAPDGTVWQGFSGLANRETQTLVDANSLFGAGSITKPMVATTILQLYEEGLLTLNDTVSQWLPELASTIPNSDRITIKQLLGHTSGIREYLAEPELRSRFFENATEALSQQYSTQDLLAFIKDKPALGEPGSAYAYSNSNYLLLGEIIEKATGSTLASQLRARIFEPLGLANSFYAPQETVSRGNITRTYSDLDDDGQVDYLNEVDQVSKRGLSWAGAAGGVVSTAADIAQFGQALFQGELLSPATLQMMINDNSDLLAGVSRPPGTAPNRLERDRYGLGIESGSITGVGEFLRHNGATIGWGAELTYLPDRQITATVLGSQPTPTGASQQEDSTFVAVTNNVNSTVQQYPVTAR
jgi:CubicO group peptidase (beta-lactamase class C family)